MAERPSARGTLLDRKPRGCGGIFFVFMVLFAALSGGSLGAFVWLIQSTQTNITALETFRPKVGSKLWSAEPRELLGEFTTESRGLAPLNEMPLHLQKAFIATEDDTFYEHKGVRPDAILNAVLYAVQTGRVRGASTITMQVVRNVEDLRVGREVTMQRKINEAITALQVEREFTKDEVLELYLNQIFLGGSAWGVEAAARQYFGKSCRDLTLGESATLAYLTRSPNVNRPDRVQNLPRTRQGRDYVLSQMLKNGFIGQQAYEEALAERLEDSVISAEERLAQLAAEDRDWAPNQFKAPYFSEEIRKRIGKDQLASDQQLFEDGLEIETTLDMRLQRAAEAALTRHLDAFDKAKLEYLKARNREDEFVPVSGALICLDNRPLCEGYVRAMVGGRDFAKEKFNTVTQAKRQPGSSVKPFVWSVALNNGMTPANIVVDEPFVRVDAYGNRWAPQNFGGGFQGPVTLRTAIEKSINIVSVKLVERFGMPLVASFIRDAGDTPVEDVHAGLTIGLGSSVVIPLEHCVAYSTFAHGGIRCEPVFITEIKDRDGSSQYKGAVRKTRVFGEDLAYAMTYLMQGVCQYGTGTRSMALKRPHAGKTGTSNDARDVWFCGYTPDYTCVVWIGYLDNRSLGQGANFTGGRLACPAWTDFMIKAHEGLPVTDFRQPQNVQFHGIYKDSGLPGGKFSEVFLRDTMPRTEEMEAPIEAGETGEVEPLENL